MDTGEDHKEMERPIDGFTCSLAFCWEVSIRPFSPTALEDINLRESFLYQPLCHPGTGPFRGSSSVKNEGFLL
jgi:hypothetical protein